MKRTISIILCALMVVLLVACGEEQKPVTGYDDLILKLSETVDQLFSDDFDKELEKGSYTSPTGELNDKWTAMLRDAKTDFKNIDENAFGYKMVDVNSDSSAELFFVRSDGRLLAVFTMYEGAPLLVDAYNRSYQCVLRDTGELYIMTVRSDGGYDFKINALNSSTGALNNTISFGQEGSICYEMIEGSIYTTSNERLSELRNEYPFEHSSVFEEMELVLF